MPPPARSTSLTSGPEGRYLGSSQTRRGIASSIHPISRRRRAAASTSTRVLQLVPPVSRLILHRQCKLGPQPTRAGQSLLKKLDPSSKRPGQVTGQDGRGGWACWGSNLAWHLALGTTTPAPGRSPGSVDGWQAAGSSAPPPTGCPAHSDKLGGVQWPGAVISGETTRVRACEPARHAQPGTGLVPVVRSIMSASSGRASPGTHLLTWCMYCTVQVGANVRILGARCCESLLRAPARVPSRGRDGQSAASVWRPDASWQG